MRVRSLNMNDAHIYCTPEQFAAKMEKLDGFMKYLIGYLTDRIHDLSGRIAD